MKIVCDNCATKYSIADEKVRGKVFKIRCKKCSHIIVVRGGADGSVEATSSRDAGPADGGFPGGGGGGEEQQAVAARGGAEPSGDAVWHLVIDREQVGPLSPSEVRAKFAGGEVDAETYAWREGFGDWLRLGSIEDFRDLGGGDAPAAPEATRRTDSADLFGGGGGDDAADAPAGDLFGGGGAAPAPAYSSAPAPAANEDVFAGGGGGALFSAPSAAPQRQARASSPAFSASSASAESAPSSGHGNGNVVDVRPMTGQRNENSVLFSLNNLQALATGGAGGGKAASAGGGGSENRPGFANSQTEGSGLIDIRAMAASTLAASPSTGGGLGSGPGELPGLGAAPVFSPMAAPILMPAAPSGPPKWMWAILGVGVLAVLGIVVVGALLLARKPPAEPTTIAQAPAAPAATTAAAAAPTAAATKPAAAAAAAPTAAAPTAAAAAATPSAAAPAEKHGKAAKGAEKGTKVAKNEPAAAKTPAAAPVAEAAPAAAAPAPKHAGGKRDELDDLLNNASPGDTPKQHKAAAAAAPKEDSGGGASDDSLPDTLDKGQIVSGMSKVKGRVQGCFDQYKVPGTASVAITISPSGRVSAANVTGQFAGTPTGDCVAKAVKTAGFSKFKGSPMSFVYPYLLR